MRIVWIPLLALCAACSSATAPSSTATASGAKPQAIVTNAPGGLPMAIPPSPNSCPSETPLVRIESDWPKADHISIDWTHFANALYVRTTFRLRDRPTVIIVKPNEHTRPGPNGQPVESHHAETPAPMGIYDGDVAFIYPGGCESPAWKFNGLNHGAQSLPNINDDYVAPVYGPKG